MCEKQLYSVVISLTSCLMIVVLSFWTIRNSTVAINNDHSCSLNTCDIIFIYIIYIIENIKKIFCEILPDIGLWITGQSNLKVVNNLDITLNLTNSKYCLYKKPDNYLLYINAKSMHTVSFPVLRNGKNCNIPKLHAAMRAAQNVSSSSFNLFFEVKVELHPHKQNRPY